MAAERLQHLSVGGVPGATSPGIERLVKVTVSGPFNMRRSDTPTRVEKTLHAESWGDRRSQVGRP